MSHNEKRPRRARASSEHFHNEIPKRNCAQSSTLDAVDAATAVINAGPLYVSRGWTDPLPLPEGLKFPPPDDVTGNRPYLSDARRREVWDDALDDPDDPDAVPVPNLGLRMPTVEIDGEAYEVLGIDVDQYDEKHGTDTLDGLVADLGELPPTWRSTSRDPDNPSGIRFFLVPAGLKWKGKPGPDIDIIQRTHRYAVVWPSVVTWDKAPIDPPRVYQWYDADGNPCDVPNVGDLPMLPKRWVDYLCKGEAGAPRNDVEEFDDLGQALAWLEKNIPGYDEDPSGQMKRKTNLDTLAEQMSAGAHDAMVARVHEVVQLAAEGHHGLKIALARIHKMFYSEVLTGDDEARRDIVSAKLEWNRAVRDEVSKLRADKVAGRVHISTVGGYAATDLDDIDVATLRRALSQRFEPRIAPVDVVGFDQSDSGRGEVFNAAMGELVQPILCAGADWAFWDESRGALCRLSGRKVIGRFWARAVIESYKQTAERLAKEAVELKNVGNTDEAGEVEKQAKMIYTAGVRAGDVSKIKTGLDMAHTLHDDPIEPTDFDQNTMTFGTPNGVLDYSNAKTKTAHDLLRKGSRADKILSMTEVGYDPEAQSALWDDYLDTFMPDRGVRQYVQKVLGYALLGKNPERRIIFLKGDTSTGKSTLIEAMQAALGDYANTFDVNALFRQKRDGGPVPELLAVVHCRMIFASEVGNRNRLHSDVIKRMVGNDSVTGRALYSNNMVTCTPMFTPIIATNSMPTIEDADAALDRRIMVLPFETQVPKGSGSAVELKTDPNALRALLSWLVDGLLDYLHNGLDTDVPAEVAKVQESALSQVNEFRRWCDRTFVEQADAPTSRRLGHEGAWKRWEDETTVHRTPKSLRDLDESQFREKMRAMYGGRVSRKLKVTNKDGTTSRGTKSVYTTPIVLRGNAGK